MLALALQQEDVSSSGSPSAPVAGILPASTLPSAMASEACLNGVASDEAVALALQQEERALFEKRRKAHSGTTSAHSVEGQGLNRDRCDKSWLGVDPRKQSVQVKRFVDNSIRWHRSVQGAFEMEQSPLAVRVTHYFIT